MEELFKSHSYVFVKGKHLRLLQEKIETIREVFKVRLREVSSTEDVSNKLGLGSKVTFFLVEPDDPRIPMQLGDTACKVQKIGQKPLNCIIARCKHIDVLDSLPYVLLTVPT